MANKISTIIDFNIQNAKSNLSNLKTSVNEAEGFMGKLDAGASGVLTTIKGFATSPAGIAALGGVIAGAGDLALKAVTDFSNLGVEIGKFATATGLSAEAASRWVEVGGDMGIDAGTLEGAIGKMNKALGNTPQVFDAAGIAIARTSSGAIDANGTFLNVIDKLRGMKDPAAQAALGAKLLGKGWQSMSELIQAGSGKLTQSLAEVSKTKVFDQSEIEKAVKFRDTMADLKDKFEDVAIAAGEKLAPAMTHVAQSLVNASGFEITTLQWTTDMFNMIAKPFPTDSWLQKSIDKATELSPAISETDRETRKLVGTMAEAADVTDTLAQEQASAKAGADAQAAANKELVKSEEGVTAAAKDQKQALQDLTSQALAAVDAKYAYREAEQAAKEKIEEATATLKDHKTTWNEAVDAIDSGRDAAVDASVAYANMKGDVAGSKEAIQDQIKSLYEQAIALDPKSPIRVALLGYIADLQAIPTEVNTTITTAYVDTGAVGVHHDSYTPGGTVVKSGKNNSGVRQGAEGGIVKATPGGQLVNVAEAGHDEALIPLDGKHGLGAASTYNITINGSNMTPNELVQAIKTYERRNGPGWRS